MKYIALFIVFNAQLALAYDWCPFFLEKQNKSHTYSWRLKNALLAPSKVFLKSGKVSDIDQIGIRLAKLEDEIQIAKIIDLDLYKATPPVKKLIHLNNTLIEDTAKLLKEKNIPFKIINSHVVSRHPHKAIELRPSADSAHWSLQKLFRYKTRFDTKKITVDYLENGYMGSAGFSNELKRRIDIGFDGLSNIIKYDHLSALVKHEFTHGSFVKKRIRSTPSIYNVDYKAQGDINLGQKIYKKYMSAEELYTFSNEPLWSSEIFTNIAQRAPADIKNNFRSILQDISSGQIVAKQTKALSDETIGAINKYIKDNYTPDTFSPLAFFTKNTQITYSAEKVHYIIIPLPDKKLAKFHLDEELWPLAENFLKKRTGLLKKFKRLSLEKIPPKHKLAIQEELLDEQQKILNILLVRQKTLNNTSRRSIKALDQSYSIFKQYKERMDNILSNPKNIDWDSWQEQLLGIRSFFKKVANVTREHSKDFQKIQ